MKRLIFQKIRNKKILNACLLMGIILLIAVASCTPMFQDGSLDMLINNKFKNATIDNNKYSFEISRSGEIDINNDELTYDTINSKMNGYIDTWNQYIELPTLTNHKFIRCLGSMIERECNTFSSWSDIGCFVDGKEHLDVLKGDLNKEINKPGVYPCYITEQSMDMMNYVIDDVVTFTGVIDENGNPIKFQIVAIVRPKKDDPYFWDVNFSDTSMKKMIFIDDEIASKVIDEYEIKQITYRMYEMYDYRYVNSKNIGNIEYYLSEFKKADESLIENVIPVIKEYNGDKKFVAIICIVLELPIFVLVLAFIYMVVNQILSMENGEIAMLTSRGFTRRRILSIYFWQSCILSFVAIILGVPLGYLMCKVAASTNGFLEFAHKNVARYSFRWSMLLYAAVAAVVAILFICIPVFFYAKNSTVQRKSSRQNKKYNSKAVLYGVGAAMLIFSVYMLVNHNRQKQNLAKDVLAGRLTDPMVFLNVTITIIGCGLTGLMLFNGLVRLLLAVGRTRMKPHKYAALLQILRGGNGSQFISIFIIFTIAMGIVNANLAGTINTNNEARVCYDVGTDIKIMEHWKTKSYLEITTKKVIKYYDEPDFNRFHELLGDRVNGMTRVIRDDYVSINSSGEGATDVTMLAVNTKEFGTFADLQSGLNDTHWYNYLNALAEKGNGVLVSANLAKRLKLEVGSTIKYTRYNEYFLNTPSGKLDCIGVVVGIFDAMPSYEKYSYDYDENGSNVEKERYEIIVNYSYMVDNFGITPYEIWMDTKEGVTLEDIKSVINENGIELDMSVGKQEKIDELRNSAVIQITNGLFTLGFIISIIVCTVGFLIYWITSIKQRELLFGIYRAMGMSFAEVNRMLELEQLLSSILSGIIGGAIGVLASVMHTGVFATVYLPKKHNIPLHTEINILNLGAFMVLLCLMIIVCLMVILRQVKKLNIVQAIKMGDD